MSTKVSPVPEGFGTITPHLCVRDAARAIAFYDAALGARELHRMATPDGARVLFVELLIGDARLFLSDEFPEQGALSPLAMGGTPVTLHLYVPDVDAVFERCLAQGMQVVIPLADFFWGERYGLLRDPFGHQWGLASRIEDLAPSEIRQRAANFYDRNRS